MTKTTWIFADSRGRGFCRSCGVSLIWAEIAQSGKRMPFNPPLVALRTSQDDDRRLLEEVDLAESHFATCPQSATWRRPH